MITLHRVGNFCWHKGYMILTPSFVGSYPVCLEEPPNSVHYRRGEGRLERLAAVLDDLCKRAVSSYYTQHIPTHIEYNAEIDDGLLYLDHITDVAIDADLWKFIRKLAKKKASKLAFGVMEDHKKPMIIFCEGKEVGLIMPISLEED